MTAAVASVDVLPVIKQLNVSVVNIIHPTFTVDFCQNTFYTALKITNQLRTSLFMILLSTLWSKKTHFYCCINFVYCQPSFIIFCTLLYTTRYLQLDDVLLPGIDFQKLSARHKHNCTSRNFLKHFYLMSFYDCVLPLTL